MKIIFISGLGYDHRIFNKLSFNEFEVVYLDWIEPNLNEDMKEYAARLGSSLSKINDSVILVGHSFGGLIAQEIASIHKIEEVILLSSIVSRREMPLWIRTIKPCGLHRLPIRKWSSNSVGFWGKLHGFDTKEKKDLFRNMVNRYSDHYFQWALRELSLWKGAEVPETTKLFQINGTRDRTFPIKNIEKPDYIIENGSHIFTLEVPGILSALIKNEVQQWV